MNNLRMAFTFIIGYTLFYTVCNLKDTEPLIKFVFFFINLLFFTTLLAFIIHNVFNFNSLFIFEGEYRKIHILFGSFSSSIDYFGGNFFRLNGFFHEPGSFGLISFLLIIIAIIYNKLIYKNFFLIFSSFSLGAYISSLFLLNKKFVQHFLKNKSYLIILIILFSPIVYESFNALFDRLNFDFENKIFGDKNRKYDFFNKDLNFKLYKDGLGTGGTSNILELLDRAGVIPTLIFTFPLLKVFLKVFTKNQYFISFGLVIFLLHKANIFTPMIIFLLALIYNTYNRKSS